MGQIAGIRLVALMVLLLGLAGTHPARAQEPVRRVETRYYVIQTDLDPVLSADLALRMDAMYEEYARRLVDFKPRREMRPLQVFLFNRQEDYMRFTGDRLKNTGGVYIPRRNYLAAFLEGQGRDGLRRTLQHEAFHQFAYTCISPNLPVWLNEGLAQLFEEGIWDGQRFWLGQAPPRRIRQLQADLRNQRILDFDAFLRLTPETWARRLSESHEDGATQYNQSWAMVYFLAHARDPSGAERYRARLIHMLGYLHQGKDAESAFREAFSDNIRGFQDRFIEYARRLGPTTEATLIDRQGVLGDLLGELSRRDRTFASFPQFKRSALVGGYRMHYSKGELEWDTEPDLRIYFADITGRALPPEKLFFDLRKEAPLPDIVCRPTDRFQLRTRFYRNGDRIEHEVLVEPPPGPREARRQ